MDKKKLIESLNEVLKHKGKRKFVQSVELIVNFRGIDFSKPENRLNLDIFLPHGKSSKTPKVAVVADENVGAEAKKAGADLIIDASEVEKYAEKSKLKKLAKEYVLLAQPNQMGIVAKFWGQVLGPRGKIPRPLVGNPKEAIERARKMIRITSRGKYLPTAQAFIGTEEMKVEELAENAEAVYEAIKGKVPEGNIKSIYVKLTMSPAVRVQ